MSSPPFTGLSDSELSALRALFAAALESSPRLACGDALRLVAAADAEASNRTQMQLPRLTAHIALEPAISSAELVASLAAAAAAVRPDVTSTTKWAAVDALLARALGVTPDAVYVTSVGGLSRNITVRLAQSRRAREAVVTAVIWTLGSEPLQQAIASATRACVEIPRLTLIFTLDGTAFDLAAIIAPPSLPAPAALTVAYPTAQHVHANLESPSADV
jgi:hypothetical protein